MKKRTLASMTAIATMVFTLISSGLAGALPLRPYSSIDTNAAHIYALEMCGSATELDCVASFGFIDSKDAYVQATLDTVNRATPFKDSVGNTVDNADLMFSGVVDGNATHVALNIPLASPKARMWKNDDGSWHLGSSLRPDLTSADLLNIKVRFVVRTSFLRPQNVQLVADEADFKQTKIDGGNAWMFEGKGTNVSNYTHDYDAPKRQNWSDRADEDTSTLHFIIHHADPNLDYGFWPARCASAGYSVQAFNSNAAGEPFWDAKNQSLNFAVPSPHLTASGKPNKGFFKLWTTDAYMKCQWIGNTLANANNIAIQIVDEDGTEQMAVSSIVHSNGKLYVSASGFHYSAPTIRLRNAKAPAVKSITCVNIKNAKLTKKVIAVSPKCPTGYKLTK